MGADQGRGETSARRGPEIGRASRGAAAGALGGVPLTLPALSRALKLQEKAAKVGFDWNDVRAVLAKLREEIAEVEAEMSGGSPEALSEEVGDLLFAAVNLARHLTSTRRRRCARPTPSSSAASPISNIVSRKTAGSRRAPISTRWRRCGSKPKRASGGAGDC